MPNVRENVVCNAKKYTKKLIKFSKHIFHIDSESIGRISYGLSVFPKWLVRWQKQTIFEVLEAYFQSTYKMAQKKD